MTVGAIAVTEGAGKNIWTDQRTVSAVAREAQYVLIAEPALATYSITASNISIATAATHVLQIMAGASLYVRVQQIKLAWSTEAATAANCAIQLYRLTTAGSGGSAVTAQPFDTGDAACGATAMTLPSVQGNEGPLLYQWRMYIPAAAGTPTEYIWTPNPRTKPIIIPVGTSYGLAFENVASVPSAKIDIVVTITETAWL